MRVGGVAKTPPGDTASGTHQITSADIAKGTPRDIIAKLNGRSWESPSSCLKLPISYYIGSNAVHRYAIRKREMPRADSAESPMRFAGERLST